MIRVFHERARAPLAVVALTAPLLAACARDPAPPPGTVPAPEAAATQAPPSASPTVDRAARLAAIAPELGREGAALVVAHSGDGLTDVDLAEHGLMLATAGFERLEPAALQDLRTLFADVYAALDGRDAAFMGEYMERLRAARLSPADSVRGRELLTRGVMALAPTRREELQTLLERAVREGVQARAVAQQRTRDQQVLAPATSSPRGPAIAQLPGEAPERAAGAVRPGVARLPEAEEDGRGEAYWRGRMQRARQDLASAEARYTAANAAAASTTFGESQRVNECPAASRVSGKQDQAFIECTERLKNRGLREQAARGQAAAEVESARSELDRAKRALASVEEEARRANALPGWLR